jgi:hypothetical protein
MSITGGLEVIRAPVMISRVAGDIHLHATALSAKVE